MAKLRAKATARLSPRYAHNTKAVQQKQKAREGFPLGLFVGELNRAIKKSRRRPTLPHGYPCSTIGSEELNFRVRDGIGCGLFENTTGNL